MFKKILPFLCLAVVSCSSLQVSDIDSETGLLPSTKQATVITNEPFDIDSRNNLLLAGEQVTGPQIAKLEYFDEIMTHSELEDEIIKNGLTDKVPSISNRIGLNSAAKNYKPFLMIASKSYKKGSDDYLQIKLIDAVDMKDIFVAERKLDYVWAGVNDQNTYYPLYNALFEYIREQSNEI